MTHRNRARRTAAVIPAAVGALILAACGGGSGSADDETIVITADPSGIAAFVAQDEGFFEEEGVDVEVSTSGFDQAGSMLIAGDTQIAWMGPLEAAQFSGEGEDFKYMSTAGALNMFNGVVVRAEDADKYKTINDLEGKKLGQPGFGTGTWADFSVFASMFYGIDDAKAAFDTATADSGALLALLEKGEIDAALLFAADSAAARHSDKFETIFSFTEAMQEEFGQPLAITGGVATDEWLQKNPEAADGVIAGLDKAVEWMKSNTQEFAEGGKYEKYAKDNGWYSSEDATAAILDLLRAGDYYLSSDTYTDEWRTAVHEVVSNGEGTLVEKVPAIDDYLAPAK
jgi:ABC-type nitrate/sulfonate/bicarbonate transport system substrate-binding protein